MLDLDLDPDGDFHADPCGSGSATLIIRVVAREEEWYLQPGATQPTVGYFFLQ